MLTKNKVKELVDHMPETFSVDDIVEEIILLKKIEIARKQVQDGEFLTEEELDKEIEQRNWLSRQDKKTFYLSAFSLIKLSLPL